MRRIHFTVVSLLALLAAAPLLAQSDTPVRTPDFEGKLTLPFWIPATHGDVVIRGREGRVDSSIWDVVESIPDLIEALDFILLGSAEFRVDRFLLGGGGTTVDLSGSGEVIRGLVSIDGEMEYDSFFLEGGYRFGDFLFSELSPSLPDLRATVDGFVGIRYVRLSGMLDFNVDRIDRELSLGDSVDWLDPIVGARVTLNSSTQGPASVTLGAHIGGGDSNFTWDAVATFDYRLAQSMSLSLGWRASGIDYVERLDGGEFRLDLFNHGPLMELNLHF